MTLTQHQLVKLEVEVCQTLLTCLHVQDFPAYVFHRTLPFNAFIKDSILFCQKTYRYSSLAKNLILGRANGRKMTIAFYFFCSLNGTQVLMNLRGFLLGKEVLLYYIKLTAAMLEKIRNITHTAKVV